MADPRPVEGEEDLPHAIATKRSRRAIPLIWVVPLVALVFAGWIGLKSLWERGPTITIEFKSAEGIEAGKTKIRHKAVDIGTVSSVRLSRDNKLVLVTAELDRDAAKSFLVDDTRFWVVRPRIAGGQISGLGTLLAGSFIGADPGKSGKQRDRFAGLETPPVVTSDVPGRQFQLRAENLGSLDINSPLYYRGVLAGRVVSTELAPDGRHENVGVFVHSPHERFVNERTRFWNESGVDLQVGAEGIKLQTESFVTLLLGGIAFENPTEGTNGTPAAENARFQLWNNRADAFKPRETVIETFVIKFPQSVRGLAVGAPVDFRGISVGEVRRLDLEFDPQNVRFLMVVEVHLYPERLRSRYRDPKRAPMQELSPKERIARFVERGFRAQLANANLLTGQKMITLDFFPKAPKAAMDLSKTPPEIPTMSSGQLAELQESIQNIVARLEKVPFEQIAADLRKALQSLDATLRKAETTLGKFEGEIAPELKATLEQGRKTLVNAEKALGSVDKALSSDSPLQGDLRETLLEVTKTMESLRALTDYLERHPEAILRGKARTGDLR
jgi:paraquat-inducible protein B